RLGRPARRPRPAPPRGAGARRPPRRGRRAPPRGGGRHRPRPGQGAARGGAPRPEPARRTGAAPGPGPPPAGPPDPGRGDLRPVVGRARRFQNWSRSTAGSGGSPWMRGAAAQTVIDDWSPFEGTSPVTSLGHLAGRVTLVEGQTFCLSGRAGDITEDLPDGLFVLDRRVLSVWELRLNDHRVEPLAVDEEDPFTATFVGRGRPSPGHADADLVVHRRRRIGNGMREEVEVENHGLTRAPVTLVLRCHADFADVFAVKEGRVEGRGEVEVMATSAGTIRLLDRADRSGRAVEGRSSAPATWREDSLVWHLELGPGEAWSTCLEVAVLVGGGELDLRFRCQGDDDAALPLRRLGEWRAARSEERRVGKGGRSWWSADQIAKNGRSPCGGG